VALNAGTRNAGGSVEGAGTWNAVFVDSQGQSGRSEELTLSVPYKSRDVPSSWASNLSPRLSPELSPRLSLRLFMVDSMIWLMV
jgi:hypothetical protein